MTHLQPPPAVRDLYIYPVNIHAAPRVAPVYYIEDNPGNALGQPCFFAFLRKNVESLVSAVYIVGYG